MAGTRLGSFPVGTTGEQFITFEWVPDPRVIEEEMLQLANKLEDWAIPLSAARSAAIYDMDLHFETESDPDGDRWTSLDEGYAGSGRKQGSAHPDDILQLTGALRAAATSERAWFISGNSLFFNTGALPSYGPIHQAGTVSGIQASVLKKLREGNATLTREEAGTELNSGRGKNLPQRRFIGLDEPTIAEIEGIFIAWFDETVVTTGGGRGIPTGIPSGSGVVVRGTGGRFIGRTGG